MVTTAERERWTEAGGTIEEKTTGKRVNKTWVAANGEQLLRLRLQEEGYRLQGQSQQHC